MKAKDAMTSPAITINQDATLREAGNVLARHGISALPVVDDEGQLVGIVSQMDLIRFNTAEIPQTGEAQSAGSESEPMRVADIMTVEVVSVSPETDLHTVAKRLSESHVRQVPVLSDTELVGVVSRRDLIKWMARSDAALTLDVVGVLSDEARRLAHLEVSVHEGVAHIEGEARHDTLVLAAKLARTVPGVLDTRVTPVER
jgi:CBS-domain-containing membrane protein